MCHRAFSGLALVLFLLFVNPADTFGATYASDGSQSDVSSKYSGASDGDTITLPTGTFDWATGLTISKAITLQGLGTITTDVNSRATECGTKIQCSVAGTVITWNLVADKTSRMTGIEFIKGSTYGGAAHVVVNGLNTDNRRMIVDRCVFNQLRYWALKIDTALGVAYKNSFLCHRGGGFTADASFWDGVQGTDNTGAGSWAEGENYGTDQFFFFENNNLVGEYCRSSSTVTIAGSGTVTFTVPTGLEAGNGTPLTTGYPLNAIFWDETTGKPDPNFSMYGTVDSYSGTTLVMAISDSTGSGSKSYWTLSGAQAGTDGQRGTRVAIRNNLMSNFNFQNHGSEADSSRGGRVFEVYSNWAVGNRGNNSFGLLRSGTALIHDNHTTNYQTAAPVVNVVNYSSTQFEFPPWGGPDGRNPWHSNAAAAIVTGTVTSSNLYTMRDNTKTWTLNQYQNYTIRATSGFSVTSMTRSGSTVTVNTSGAHGLTTGDSVSIMGANQRWYNRLYSECTVVDSDTFTVVNTMTPATPATGTILCRPGGYYGLIQSSATDGTAVWVLGVNGDHYALKLRVGDTYEINQVYYVMDQCGMGAGSSLANPIEENPPTGWPDQAVSPVYWWNSGGLTVDNRIDFSGCSYATIVPGRNLTNAVYPYETYTYPHPLTAESGGSEPATSVLPAVIIGGGVQFQGGVEVR